MSYRQRLVDKPARDHEIAKYELEKDFRHVFNGAVGERVLDHIVQRICGVDAIVLNVPPERALEVLTRKNVGLEIARLALGSADDNEVKVKT